MSRLQEHMLRLLREIDAICSANGIEYSLAEHSAWDAVKFGKYHGGMYDTCVMMEIDAALRFEKCIVGDNRALVADGVAAAEGMTKRYVDTSSTLFDMLNPKRLKYPHVGVDIRVMQVSDANARMANPKGEIIELPCEIFNSTQRMEIGGYGFSIISGYDVYFAKLIGEDWRKINWKYPVPKEPSPAYNLIYAETVPFDELKKRPVFRRNTSALYLAKRWLYGKWRKRRYDKIVATSERYELYLKVTEDRFKCWEHYYPHKEELIKLAEKDPTSPELEERLSLLLQAIVKHEKKGFGFSFDEDLLQVALPIIQKSKGQKYVDDLLKIIPDAYRNSSIEQELMAAGVDHPLLTLQSA